MPGALLETKPYPPPRRRSLVARPRLSALIEHASETRLTVVSAPPSFGKSTLLAEWFADPEQDAASSSGAGAAV